LPPQINPSPSPIPNPSISSHQSQIEQWIGKKNWQLLYKATRDGFKASDFHSKCDNQGSTVTIITSKKGYRFGGYTPFSWNSSSRYVQDSSKQSFIFTLTNPHNIPPSKYPLIKPECAIYCHPNFGPIFGSYSYDIYVSDKSNQNDDSFTDFPNSYSDTTGKGKRTFTGKYYFSTREIEVFKVF
jgi:hypothetical protein